MSHRDVHPAFVEDCFGCKLLSVHLAPSASGSVEASSIKARDKRWDRDMQSYKAMRKQGLQPRGIDGCSRLEGAHDQFEVTAGHLLNAEQRKQAKEGIALTQEILAGNA